MGHQWFDPPDQSRDDDQPQPVDLRTVRDVHRYRDEYSGRDPHRHGNVLAVTHDFEFDASSRPFLSDFHLQARSGNFLDVTGKAIVRHAYPGARLDLYHHGFERNGP